MDIGIVGSGRIGSILARHLAALGHQVRIANFRGPESLAALAAETGATASTVEQAVSARDVVIVTIPQKAVPELPRGLFAVSTAVVVDTGNYYPARDGRIDAIDEGLTDSEWVTQVLGRPVVKGFNNILAASLDSRGTPEGTPGRVCLSVAGDEPAAKQVVLRLLGELGFDSLDGGSLAESWRQQPGTPAYCMDLDRTALQTALSVVFPWRRRDPRPMHFRLQIAILGAKEGGGGGGEFWSRRRPFPPPPKCLREPGRFQGIGEDG